MAVILPNTGVISGNVWNDLNNNGLQDANESAKSGVTVKLYSSINGQPDTLIGTTTSDVNGSYSFTNVTAGNYIAQFISTDGSVLTQSNVGADDTIDSDADINGYSNTFTLANGATETNVDAGFVSSATSGGSISARVWVDSNGNGLQEGGESGAAGVVVHLYSSQQGYVGSTTTDANGNYQFTGLTADNYRVQVIRPDNSYLFTTQDAGNNDTIDSDFDSDGFSNLITLSSGQSITHIDAGLTQPIATPKASINSNVWNDTNGNGLQDASETGKADVTVKLYTSVNGQPQTLVGTTTTDANGNYSFSNLPAGNYIAQFISNDGSVLTQANVGSDDSKDSDANPNGYTNTFTLTPGTNDTSIDAGFTAATAKGSISARVWVDNNANGLQDGGENGVANVTVHLYSSQAGYVGSTTTDSNGNYQFNNLDSGYYRVQVVKPDGSYLFTTQDAGNNDSIDSDFDNAGFSNLITLSTGQAVTHVDAGLFKAASITSNVWIDSNGNGLQDNGELGKAGVTVQLYASNNGQPGTLIGATTTDASGNYSFNNLTPGSYIAKFVANDGSVLTQANVGTNDAIDSDANANSYTNAFTLNSGAVETSVDAGFFTPVINAQINSNVWVDSNANGLQENGELGKAGVTVQLYANNNGQPGTLIGTTATDASGNYSFSNLTPGSYIAKFVASDGSVLTQANVGTNDAIDSDANANGFTNAFTLSSGAVETSVDAGFFNKATIGDHVWRDANGNGIQDSSESGLANVTVRLLNSAGSVVASTTTDSNGNYSFNADPGSYKIQVVKPESSYSFTGKDLGGNDNLDSDVDSTGTSALFTVTSGQVIGNLDAGLTNQFKGSIIGDSCITEGTTKSFKVQLDHAVTQDTWVTVQVNDGTAHQVNESTVREGLTNANWLLNSKSFGFGVNEWVQLYSSSQLVDQQVLQASGQGGWSATFQNTSVFNAVVNWWQNNALYTQSTWHNVSSPNASSVMYQDTNSLINDFRVLNASGTVQTGHTFQVKVLAGADLSESFQINASKEVYEGNGYFGRFATESNENFSLQVTQVGGSSASPNSTASTITILDVRANLSPIAIDLDGDGVQTIGLDRGVQFDMLNNGERVNTGWLSGKDAFLAIDSNNNGSIDNISELFGGKVGDGFAKLASFDSNSDGVVNLSDDLFGQLRLWQDANENGVTDNGELISLSDAGIASLNVDYVSLFQSDSNGNVHGEQSIATFSNGNVAEMTDVYFAIGSAPAEPELQPIASDPLWLS